MGCNRGADRERARSDRPSRSIATVRAEAKDVSRETPSGTPITIQKVLRQALKSPPSPTTESGEEGGPHEHYFFFKVPTRASLPPYFSIQVATPTFLYFTSLPCEIEPFKQKQNVFSCIICKRYTKTKTKPAGTPD